MPCGPCGGRPDTRPVGNRQQYHVVHCRTPEATRANRLQLVYVTPCSHPHQASLNTVYPAMEILTGLGAPATHLDVQLRAGGQQDVIVAVPGDLDGEIPGYRECIPDGIVRRSELAAATVGRRTLRVTPSAVNWGATLAGCR